MALTVAQQSKQFVESLSACDQAALNSMSATKKKELIDKMMAAKKRVASSISPEADLVYVQIPAWDISGDKDMRILCGAFSADFRQCSFSFICPRPCGLFVAQTAKAGERPDKSALQCESCYLPIAPHTAYWPRNTKDGKRRHNHVNFKDCNPTAANNGKCGRCVEEDAVRVHIHGDGEPEEVCKACFVQHRADYLQVCQPAAIEKRESKATPATSPAKRART